MINKELLHLPGAKVSGSVILGLLHTVGAVAELVIMILSIYALGFLWGLPVPGLLIPLVGRIPALAVSLVVLILVRGLCLLAISRCSASLGTSISTALSEDLYLSMFDGRQRKVDGNRPNQSLAMLSTEGVKRVASYFTDFLPILFQSVMMLPVVLLVLLPVSPVGAIVVLVGMVVMPFTLRMGTKRNTKVQTAHLRKYDKVGVHFEESLRGLNTLKIFHADQAEADRLAEDSEGFRRQTMAVLAGQLRSLINADMMVHLTVILAAVLTVLVQWGSGPRIWLLPSIVVVLTCVRLFAPAQRMSYLAHAGVVATRQGKAIAAIRRERQEEEAHDRADREASGPAGSESSQGARADTDARQDRATVEQVDPGDGEGAGAKCGVKAGDLRFTYPDGFTALHALNFELPQQGHIGIVGASGSGKSTLASILSGQLKGYEGSLSVFGNQVSRMSPSDLITSQTVVRGTDHLFSGTLRSNLDPAGVGYSDEVLKQALRDVDLQDLLNRPEGLESRLEPGGSNLSGGQRQRLSIARGLLRGSRLYIFDEATSAVDREHDASLSALMDRLGRSSLVITITHRLAGVRDADRILLLDQGHLVESGDFDQLMEAGGLFAAQWNEQERYEELEAAR